MNDLSAPPAATRRIPHGLWLALLLSAAACLSLGLGRYAVSPGELLHFLGAWLGPNDFPAERYALLHSLIVEVRLPRLLAALLVGAGLSVSGAAYQAVFRNPLVSPGLLGVLSGCAFGAALGMLLGLGGAWVPVLGGVSGLLAVALGVGIAGLFRHASMLILVLGGIVSNALFNALLSVIKYLADPLDQLPSIVYWTLGSLAAVDNAVLAWAAPLLALAILAMCLLGRAIDALSLSDEEALSLGVPVRPLRYGVIALATLISALTVSIAGMVGWVGLLIPHLARLLSGPANARLLPMSAGLGGLFLLLADDLARTLTQGEIPLGIFTELLGALAFMLLLNRVRRGWL